MLGLAGDLPLSVDHDFLDWLVGVSTAVAALGTLSAVLVTLYFNVWRVTARQPKLSVDLIEESEFGVGWNPREPAEFDSFGQMMIVRNERGRATAHDVQVLLDLGREIEPGEWCDFLVQQPLVWVFGRNAGGIGTITTDIPPGVSRKFFTAFIGEPNAAFAQLYPHEHKEVASRESGQELDENGEPRFGTMAIAGALATFPVQQEDVMWIHREGEYRMRFTVTARDVDARIFEASLSFRMSDHAQDECFLQPIWSELAERKPEDLSGS